MAATQYYGRPARGTRTGIPLSIATNVGYRHPLEQKFLAQPMTDDEFLLYVNGKNAQKTREMKLKADIDAAQRKGQFLSSIGPNDLATIYDAPQNDREAQLQKIIQDDINARELGTKLMFAGQAANERRYARDLPYMMQIARLNQTLANSRFNQALAAARLEDARNNEQAKRERLKDQMENLEDYRGQNLARQDQNFAQRVQQQGVQNDFRSQANARAEQNAVRNQFIDAMNAMKAGASNDQMDAAFAELFPKLTPTQQRIALGMLGQRAQETATADTMASRYNNFLQQSAAAVDSGDGQGIRNAIQAVILQATKDPVARKYIMFDPMQRSFVPMPRVAGGIPGAAASAMQPSYQPDTGTGDFGMVPEEQDSYDMGGDMIDPETGDFMSAVQPRPQVQSQPRQQQPALRDGLYKGKDGFLYRVVNGVPQRINRRQRMAGVAR